MNNAVPDLVKGANWEFAVTRIMVELRRHDYTAQVMGQPDPNNEEKLRAMVVARDALEHIASVKCQICGGFGHSKKVCPTERKLTSSFAFARVASSALVAARQSQVVVNAHHRRPQMPSIPPNVGSKRRRSHPVLVYSGPPRF